jgi:hypothetical protein
MKTFQKILASCCLIFLFTAGYGQSSLKLGDENIRKTSGLDRSAFDNPVQNGPTASPSRIYSDDQLIGERGTMYFLNEWSDGKAYLADNTVLDHIKLRYNIYFGQMQFILNGDTLAFAKPEEVNCLKFRGMTFVNTDYRVGNEVKNDWFEVVCEGQCQLLFRRMVKYHLVAEEDAEREVDNSYVKCCAYYVKNGDQPAELIRPKKKNVACVFSDKEELISEFIKNHRLNLKKKDDLVAVVDYYNNLRN